MIDPNVLEDKVVRPVLVHLGKFDSRMNTESSVHLLMGTAAQESDLGTYLTQIKGPAISPLQIEGATHQSLWTHYLSKPSKSKLAILLIELAPPGSTEFKDGRWFVEDWALLNIWYATAIARVKYWPKVEPLPKVGDLIGLGDYWDKHYNGNPLKGTPEEFVDSWHHWLKDWRHYGTSVSGTTL